MILSDTINQRYRYAQGKTPTQIQQELRKIGVNGNQIFGLTNVASV